LYRSVSAKGTGYLDGLRSLDNTFTSRMMDDDGGGGDNSLCLSLSVLTATFQVNLG